MNIYISINRKLFYFCVFKISFYSITRIDDWKPSATAFHFLRTHFPEESYAFDSPAVYDMSQVRKFHIYDMVSDSV